jgi:hypothetical protein
MRKFFQYIRKKPKAVRDNYAFAIAGSFTFVVMIIWFVAQPDEGMFSGGGGDLAAEVKNSPFSTFFKESKEQMASLKGIFSSEELIPEDDTSARATSSGSMMLSQDDLDIAKSKLEQSTTTSLQPIIYQEVMIGTTSDSRLATSSVQNSASTTSATSI